MNANCYQLVIIESLRPTDSKTAQNLFHGIIKYKQYQDIQLKSVLHVVSLKSEFLKILEDLHLEIASGGIYPILHIEMHGYEEGLQLGSGEIIHWNEIMPVLRKINVLLRNTLMIILGACEGLSLGFRHDINERAGFAIIISSSKKIPEYKILMAFESFYDTYLTEGGLVNALHNMNAAIDEYNMFSMLTANVFFDTLVEPTSGWIDYEAEKYALKNSQKYAGVSVAVLKIKSQHEIAALLSEWKKKKPYFMMEDLGG